MMHYPVMNGHTELIAHIGDPTHSFKAPLIYNPHFGAQNINAMVVTMGCAAEDFAAFLPTIFKLKNMRGALITMPHKISVVNLLDEVSTTVKVAGACNAVKKVGGKLHGDMFDGEGFVRGLARKGFVVRGAAALVVGSGGVGSAIAASLAKHGIAALTLYDVNQASSEALAQR
ncbi:MAG: Shikimate dehydrogenase, partial [Pseudomonadota bacterium]